MNKKVVKINGSVELLKKRMEHFKKPQAMEIEYISTFKKKGVLMVKHTIGVFKVGKPYKSLKNDLTFESPYTSVVESKIKQHSNGNYYLELHTMRNHSPKSDYTINGELVDKETYMSMLPPSKRNQSKVDYFIVKAENVISVR